MKIQGLHQGPENKLAHTLALEPQKEAKETFQDIPFLFSNLKAKTWRHPPTTRPSTSTLEHAIYRFNS